MAGVHALFGSRTNSLEVDVQEAAYGLTVVEPGTATVSVSFNADGTVSIISTSELPYNWLVDGVNSGLEIKFETTTGTVSSGTTGAWLTLDTDQAISVSKTGTYTKTWTGIISIRLAAAPFTVLDSAVVSLEANVTAEDGGSGPGPGGGGPGGGPGTEE